MSFSGQPYVDTRLSFNSFLPKDLPNSISKKLVDSYTDILEKIQNFMIKLNRDSFTSWFPNFYSHAVERLSCYGFTDNEILVLENSLKKITQCTFSS